jgi:hypothetical protein
MSKLRLALVIPALTLGLALLASVVYAQGQGNLSPAATDQVAHSKSDLQTKADQKTLPTAKDDATSNAKRPPSEKTKAARKNVKKHPPTAEMDKAVSPDKSTTETPSSAKQPATSAMDRAVPEQKSPK